MGEFEEALVEAMETCPTPVKARSKGIPTEVWKHLSQHLGISPACLASCWLLPAVASRSLALFLRQQKI